MRSFFPILRRLSCYPIRAANPLVYSDGERFENYGEYKRPVRQCCGSKGLRSQQSVEGKIDWLSFGREKGGY